MKKILIILFALTSLIGLSQPVKPTEVISNHTKPYFQSNIKVADTLGASIIYTDAIYDQSNFVDIREFSALGDSATENSTAIQIAADSARSQDKPLLIPKGDFLVRSTINLNGIQVYGYGYESHIFSDRNDTIFNIIGDSTYIEYIAITGSGSGSDSTTQIGIYIDDAERCIIQNCSFKGLGGYAIRAHGDVANGVVNENRITYNYFDANRYGLFVEGRHEYCDLTNNYFIRNLLIAMYVAGGNNQCQNNTSIFNGTGFNIVNDGTGNSSHLNMEGSIANHNTFNYRTDDLLLGVNISGQNHAGLSRFENSDGVILNSLTLGAGSTIQFDSGKALLANSFDLGATIEEDYNSSNSNLIKAFVLRSDRWKPIIGSGTNNDTTLILENKDKVKVMSVTDDGYANVTRLAAGIGVTNHSIEARYNDNLTYSASNPLGSMSRQHIKLYNTNSLTNTNTSILMQLGESSTLNGGVFFVRTGINDSEMHFATEVANSMQTSFLIDDTRSIDFYTSTGSLKFQGENGLDIDITNGNIRIWKSGANLSTGSNDNILIGDNAGNNLSTSCDGNTVIGDRAMEANTATSVSNNSVYGNLAAFRLVGSNNTVMGARGLETTDVGSNNTTLGFGAGFSSGNITGSVFLGHNAGYFETTDNRLYISNTNTTTPLVYGEFDNKIIRFNGEVGVNTNPAAGIDFHLYKATGSAVGRIECDNSSSGVLQWQLYNDANKELSIGKLGSLYNVGTFGQGSGAILNREGNLNIVQDCNDSIKWYTDVTDSQDLSATMKMVLSPAGDLDVTGNITSQYVDGQLYTDDGSVTVTNTVADTYYTITGLTDTLCTNVTFTDSTFTITEAGRYDIEVYANGLTSDTNNSLIHFSFFSEDIEYTYMEAERKVSTAGDVGSASMGGYIDADVGDVFKIKAKSDNAGSVTTFNHFNFKITRR